MYKTEKKQQVLEILRKQYGIIYSACQTAGINRTTFYNWKKSDPEFAAAVAEIEEEQIDRVEAHLLQLIEDNDIRAIIFYLKTKGRKRGWSTTYIEEQKERKVKEDNVSGTVNDLIEPTKGRIVELLKDQGKYTPELDFQIEAAAITYARLSRLSRHLLADDYDPVLTSISREGNERQQSDPRERQYNELQRLLLKQLTAIGMTTQSPERKTDNDDFGDFLNEFKENIEEKP